MSELVIGIDLGGTIVRAGAINSAGELLAVRETPIEAARGPAAGLQRIAELILQTIEAVPLPPAPLPHAERGVLRGIGVGSTGPLDIRRGTINNPYTLPTWENVPIVGYLQERFGVPVTLENDADVAALGEYWKGAGQGVGRLYAITVGTGIGNALIVDGRIYRGLDGAHPEGGHMLLDPSGPACYCGAHGCWESLCSGEAIARSAQETLAQSPGQGGDLLLGLAQGDPQRITARLVAVAAERGDALARQVMEKAARYFALGVVNVITLFVPDVIVLSGGVMKSAALFMPVLQEAILRHSLMVPSSQVRIVPAQLGYYAGLYGAAYTIINNVT